MNNDSREGNSARLTFKVLAPMVSIRSYYSSWHLWSARHFARLAEETEDQHTGCSVFDIEHRAHVTAGVLSSVAFLEAAINELLKDARDSHESYIEPLSSDDRRGLASVWQTEEEPEEPFLTTLQKYEQALAKTARTKFDRGAILYQNAKLVTDLRNALVHYRPESGTEDTLDKLGRALRNKFPANRLMEGARNPYFPDHCLGAGAARWAVDSVESFADEFFDRLGITPNYQRTNFKSP